MSSQKKFLFVLNPISGGSDKSDMQIVVEEYAQAEGVTLVKYETTGENDESAILKLYKEHNPERILVAGGDGTIKMVAEAVEHTDAIIGVLPAGSANGLSVDLNLPKDFTEVLKIAFSGNVMEMDLVCINDKKSLHLSDIGVNAELIKNYENSNIRGKLGYALQAFNTLTDMAPPFHVKVEANGAVTESEARMVVIANTQRYGTGVTINPYGVMDDGKFEIVILKNMDLLVIGKILSGNMPVDSSDDIEIISTDKAVITTNMPVDFQIDGEYYGQEERLEVRILHKDMKVAVPSSLT